MFSAAILSSSLEPYTSFSTYETRAETREECTLKQKRNFRSNKAYYTCILYQEHRDTLQGTVSRCNLP